MKKKKLSLQNLKVKSFVTDLESINSKTVKGGTGLPISQICAPTNANDCDDEFTNNVSDVECGGSANNCDNTIELGCEEILNHFN